VYRKFRFLVAVFLAALLLPLVAATSAWASPVTTVSISGQVSIGGSTLTLHASASGTSASLTGHGVDTTFHGGPPPPGTCEFPLTGSISGSVVTLSGAVSKATDPTLVGASVLIVADGATGSITFTFGGTFVLTGTGTVQINNP
jgi:hypothetical protein